MSEIAVMLSVDYVTHLIFTVVLIVILLTVMVANSMIILSNKPTKMRSSVVLRLPVQWMFLQLSKLQTSSAVI